MVDFYNIRYIFRNPAFGLVPLFIFSILVGLVDTWVSTGVTLILSLAGYFTVLKQNRLIYNISILVFTIGLVFSFSSFFISMQAVGQFLVLEIIFVLALITMRLSRKRIVMRLGKTRNQILRNYLQESFRVTFQTQYGLSIHLLLVLLFFLFDGQVDTRERGTFILLGVQVLLLAIVLLEGVRLIILRHKLVEEEWLPVVSEQGHVTGRVAKSITKGLKNRFMHPVVRVALIYQGSIYLQERDPHRLLNPGALDYPFEKYMEFNEDIDNTVRQSVAEECGSNELPLRFLLKYTFENDITKRLIFLYVSLIEEEALFNSLNLKGGKLWTEAQITDNLNSNLFSECFELEFEYLKNTVLMVHRFKNKQSKA